MVGAGSSALLAMLPAPKKSSTLAAPAPKMLGSGAGGNESGVIVEAPRPVGGGSEGQDSEELSFLPAFLRKPRNAPPPSISKLGVATVVNTAVPPPTAAPESEEVNFFSIGKFSDLLLESYIHLSQSIQISNSFSCGLPIFWVLEPRNP